MRLIDLFAGCGGLTEGFHRAGFDPVLAVEWDRSAAATYAENFGDHVICDDIAKVPEEAFAGADAVVGGPPCQGFSNLGTRNPDDPRNLLWREYARVVRVTRPAVFVLENVPQFLKSDQFGMLVDWSRDGPLRGYELTAGVLNAADYGVPQRRSRAIVVGSLHGPPSLPPPSHGKDSTVARWATVRDAFAGIPLETGPTLLPACRLESGIPGPFKVTDLHLSRRPRERSMRRYELIPPGGGRFDLPDHLLPDCWRNKPTGTVDVMGRMEWDKPSLTIRTEFFKPEKGRYLHPQWDINDPDKCVNRSISHWEAARLQSFPDDFVWCGSKIEIAKQIGNAVPPLLAEAVARHLITTVLV
ncbi:MAG: DNA cytosine methyltransferase [Caldilineaceae bacterium]|nr:DNA cytosine methyltransferase [Caldilineaceae bacterium]